MSEQVQIFENGKFGKIRTLVIDNQPWFVGKDVAEILGYSNTRDAIRKHVDSIDKADVAICDGRQNRNMTIINESGLYKLIFSSKLPNAREFTHWVTSEVLPQIRLYGGYIPGNTPEEVNQNALDIANRKIADLNKQFSELNYQYQLMRNDNNQLNNRLNQLYDEIEAKCNAEVERNKYYTTQDVLNTVHAPIDKNDIDLYIQILGWKKQVGLSITVDGSKISQLFAGEDGIIFTEEGYKELVHFINHSRKVIYYNLKETNLI